MKNFDCYFWNGSEGNLSPGETLSLKGKGGFHEQYFQDKDPQSIIEFAVIDHSGELKVPQNVADLKSLNFVRAKIIENIMTAAKVEVLELQDLGSWMENLNLECLHQKSLPGNFYIDKGLVETCKEQGEAFSHCSQAKTTLPIFTIAEYVFKKGKHLRYMILRSSGTFSQFAETFDP